MGEMIKYGLKLAIAAVTFSAVLLAITLIINLITTVVFGGVLGEVLSLIGVFMPWNASAMAIFNTALSGAISFVVAYKIYQMMSNLNSQT